MAKKPTAKKPQKDNSMRNAIIGFGVTLLGYASIFSFHRLSDFLLGGGVALAVASLIKVMTTPMKGLHAPSTSDKIDVEDVQDEYARGIIVRGLELLSELRSERDAINEYVFTRRLNELAKNYGDLLNKVVADHDKATHLRKLNSYYIPTAIKLLQSYREAKVSGTSYMEISATREDILKSLDQLIEATKTLMKKMLKTNLETIDIKIEVLENILKADGYITNDLTEDMRTSAESAAKQIPIAQQMTPGVQQPAQPVKSAPAVKPVQPLKPVQAAQPAAASKPAVKKPAADPRPTIQVNMPTASAQQLHQGAPVLQVPGMMGFDKPDADDEQSARY